MKRSSELIPGYDCIFARCTRSNPCQSEAPGSRDKIDGRNHGICPNRWFYSVTLDDKSRGVSLEVSSGKFPDSIPGSHFVGYRPKAPIGNVLTWHSVHHDSSAEINSGCTVLDTDTCYCDYSFLRAEAFFDRYGVNQLQQSEEFWKAMEGLLAK